MDLSDSDTTRIPSRNQTGLLNLDPDAEPSTFAGLSQPQIARLEKQSENVTEIVASRAEFQLSMPAIAPSGPKIKVIETVPAEILGVSPSDKTAYILFQPKEGATKRYITLEALRNAGIMNPAQGDTYEFRVIETGDTTIGRFVRKTGTPEVPVSESELPLTPNADALEDFLKRHRDPSAQ